MQTSTRAALAIFALLGACGGSAPPVDTDDAFRAIQVHEATIAHRSAAVEACEPTGPCPAELELCAAVEALCQVSRSIDDPDARARCADARQLCPPSPCPDCPEPP